jgi:hypothetical protein
MRAALIAALAAGVLATAGEASASPPTVLSASPTQLTLLGSSRGEITVVNAGRAAVRLGATTGDYSIASDGRVRVGRPSTRSARVWLTARPRALDLAPGERGTITVASRIPASQAPGDAHALVLIETKTPAGVKVGVRTRIGVGVLVRVKGELRRKLAITGARVAGRTLRIGLANRGNVNERLLRGQIRIALMRGGRTVARMSPRGRNLLPGGRGTIRVALPRGLQGRVRAVVRVTPAPARLAGPGAPAARPLERTFRIVVRK